MTYSRSLTQFRNLAYVNAIKKRQPDPRALKRGEAIKAARTAKGLSQQQVADALGLKSREAVSNWERGEVGELERVYRLGLCKLLGFEELELLLDPAIAQKEFDMPISRDAKSIAYRWDDLPESVQVFIKGRIAETERMLRENPEMAKRMFPEIDKPTPRKR